MAVSYCVESALLGKGLHSRLGGSSGELLGLSCPFVHRAHNAAIHINRPHAVSGVMPTRRNATARRSRSESLGATTLAEHFSALLRSRSNVTLRAMANSAPPHTFKLDSSWPTWDKYRSARLAWYEFARELLLPPCHLTFLVLNPPYLALAEKKGFVAKHLATQHTISLACAHAGCEAECFIEFRGDVRAEKVTHLVLEHNHRLSKLNGALAQAQAKKITALKDDLYEYGLGELNRINLNGSYEKAVEADRPALQQSTLLDLRRALKSRALTVLEAAARDAGYLIGFESKDKAIIVRLRDQLEREA